MWNYFFMIIKSKVIKGGGVGKELGFPTANLDVGLREFKELNFGVYVCEIGYKDKIYKGLLHYGLRKTFEKEISTEVLILDFEEDLYDKEIEVKIKEKIRDIQKFSSREELVKQIKKDVKNL